MNAYDLPTSVSIGDRKYGIRYGWHTIVDILIAMEDPELGDIEKQEILLRIFYPEYKKIPQEDIGKALEMACEFIDHGNKPDAAEDSPRLFSWKSDASIIIPAVNAVCGKEIRSDPNLHWWSFLAFFIEIRESLFSDIVSIRRKVAHGEKLEKNEKEFLRKNKSIVELPNMESRKSETDFWEELLKE